MEKSIIINSKEYEVPRMDFGTICQLEDLGVDFQNLQGKSFNLIRGLVAITINCGAKKATNEINEHIKNGGSIDDLTPLIEAVFESDFFQNLTKKHK